MFWAAGFLLNYAVAVALAGMGWSDAATGFVANAIFCGMQNLKEE